MSEALETIGKLLGMNLGIMAGVLCGGLGYHWLAAQLKTPFEMKDAALLGGVVGALVSGILDMLLVSPFIRPKLRKRERERRLRDCRQLQARRLLASASFEDVRKKIILSYFFPKEQAKKKD